MRPISIIRQKNLLFLIEQYGTIAKLNIALGRPKTDATLSQVKNFALHTKTKKPREMGVALARDIEKKLNYPNGWMDEEHPEIQPEPENQEQSERFALKENHLKKLDSGFTSIPLYEIRSRLTDGRFVPFKTGEIEMPQIFIDRSAYAIQPEKLQSFYVDDLTATDFVPFGSIIVLDKSIHNYIKDGLYLVELNGGTFFRKIISSAKGGFLVYSSLDNYEHVQNLEGIKIRGFGLFYWAQQKL